MNYTKLIKEGASLVHHVSTRFLWHVCHALAIFLLFCVIFERLVPGSVLGHLSLYLAVPLLVICMTLHPLPKTPTRWWTFVDLWMVAILCVGRIWMQLSGSGPLAWLLAGCVTLLVGAFVWEFRSQEV